MRAGLFIATSAVAAMMATLLACNKNAAGDRSSSPMVSEGVLACESMIKDFERANPDEASEEELVRLMTLARENHEVCRRQFQSNAVTPADSAFYNHRAQQFRLNELIFEAALSRRFDGFAGYCVILNDMAQTLRTGAEEMDTFFRTARPTGEDLRRLTELYRLDRRSLEVLNTQLSVTCGVQ